MAVLEHSVWVQAQPEEVWRIYVDPARIPEWQTGSPVIQEIRGAGGEAGSTYVSKRGPGTARTTVLEEDRPRRLVTRTEAYFGCDWPPGLRLLGKLVEQAILSRREGRKELANLKALVEREAKRSG